MLLELKRDHTVKDLTQKLSVFPQTRDNDCDGIDQSPPATQKRNLLFGQELSGLLCKAKEGLEKSKSKGELSRSTSADQSSSVGGPFGDNGKKLEPIKSENEMHWEVLVSKMSRPLRLCDLDFTDLQADDDCDELTPRGIGGLIPPPPPPGAGMSIGPPAPLNLMGPPPPLLMNMRASPLTTNGQAAISTPFSSKSKKTVREFVKICAIFANTLYKTLVYFR